MRRCSLFPSAAPAMLDHHPDDAQNTRASDAPNPGDIISDRPGDFVGIRTQRHW
jgi:hypothetical protein